MISLNYPSFNDVVKARENLKETAIQHWIHDDLFSWQWWFLLSASILPWVVWIIFRDKQNSYEIFSYGLLWASISTSLDVIGGELILWGYPDKLLPMVPPMFPADITVIPISFMFIYQFTNNFKKYLLWSIVISAVFAFVLEALFIKTEMFILHNWKHTYSFWGFIIISIITYKIIKMLSPNNANG